MRDCLDLRSDRVHDRITVIGTDSCQQGRSEYSEKYANIFECFIFNRTVYMIEYKKSDKNGHDHKL